MDDRSGNDVSNLLQAVVVSRKISLKSMTRHFAKWKSREFILNRQSALLYVKTPGRGPTTTVALHSPSVSLGRHDYSPDSFHWLWLKYFDKDEDCPKEIIMKFEQVVQQRQWEKELQSILSAYNLCVHEESDMLMFTLAAFLQEQASLQTILTDDPREDSAVYFTNHDDEPTLDCEVEGVEDTDSLQVSVLDSTASSAMMDSSQQMPFAVTNMSTTGKPVSIDHSLLQKSAAFDGKAAQTFASLHQFQAMKIRVPHLNILLMAVGTRGDVQPFLELGLILRTHGHFVRLATHENFRSFVQDQGLDFYPLAGDPLLLSEFMVKTQGFILPTSPELIRETPRYHAMMVDILHSCWDACTLADSKQPASRPFSPDAIISNPVTYGHIHCAEALGVPLHLMFPQPWIPTKAFPHPLSGLNYSHGWCSENFISYQVVDRLLWMSLGREINNFRIKTLGLEPIRVGQSGWNILNYHQVPFVKMWSPSLVPKPKDWPAHVDVVGTFFPAYNAHQAVPYAPSSDLKHFLNSAATPTVCVGFGSMVVDDLEGVIALFLQAAALLNVRIIVQIGWSTISADRFNEMASHAQRSAEAVHKAEEMNDLSQSLIFPKLPEKALNNSMAASQSVPSREDVERGSLGEWLMEKLSFTFPNLPAVVKQESASASRDWDWAEVDYDATLREGNISSASDEQPIVSSSTDRKAAAWNASSDAFFMGPCPHDWLFQQVNAVVHHGGAGTTAMGLRYGQPTWICPFFGDQFFWGERIHTAGLGARPCPVQQLTLEIVLQSLEVLLFNTKVRDACKKMSEVMKLEDGVGGAVQAFYRHLPLQNMVCDLSLFRKSIGHDMELDLAEVFCTDCGLKMSKQAFQVLHALPALCNKDHHCRPCVYMDYSMQAASSATEGLMLGVGGLVHEMVGGLADATADPLTGIYAHGLQGGIDGVISGVHSLLHRPVVGSNVLYSRLKEGLVIYQELLRKNGEDDGDGSPSDIGGSLRSVLLVDKDSNHAFSALQHGRTSSGNNKRIVQGTSTTSALTNDLRRQRIKVRSECRRRSPSTEPALALPFNDDVQPSDRADSKEGNEEQAFQQFSDRLRDLILFDGNYGTRVDPQDGFEVETTTEGLDNGAVALSPARHPAQGIPLSLSLLVPDDPIGEQPLRTQAGPDVYTESPLLGSFYLQHRQSEVISALPLPPVPLTPSAPFSAPWTSAAVVDASERAQSALALFRRLGARRRYISEARFVHVLHQAIARDELQHQDDAPKHLDDEQRMAAMLLLLQRLTQHSVAQVTACANHSTAVHSSLSSQRRGLDFVDFVLFVQHLSSAL